MLSSTIYTIGTALNRAQACEVSVEVLVEGQWLHGHVSGVDGHGVVLHCDDGSLAMIRAESIDVVLVRQVDAFEGRDEVEPRDAQPMPAAAADRYEDSPHLVRPRASIEGQCGDRESRVR